uniref:Uncharacterized protein n=1 Tax=Trichogramma kaykai TaxID=54128 RepID=A0ABD2W9K8_9HYME
MEHNTPTMKSEARTTLTRGRRMRGPRPLQHASWCLKREPHSQDDNRKKEEHSQGSAGSENHTHKMALDSEF